MCRIVTGLAVVWGALGALALAGCGEGTLASGPPDLVWGRRGIGEAGCKSRGRSASTPRTACTSSI